MILAIPLIGFNVKETTNMDISLLKIQKDYAKNYLERGDAYNSKAREFAEMFIHIVNEVLKALNEEK